MDDRFVDIPTKGATIFSLRDLADKNLRLMSYELERLRILNKGVHRMFFDNSYNYVTNAYGDLFAITIRYEDRGSNTIYDDRNYHDVTIYDAIGHEHLITIIQDNHSPVLTSENVEKIEKRLEEYTQGFTYCADCKKKVKRVNIAGCHFASHFCRSCWSGTTGKYKLNGGWKKYTAGYNYD